jgi:hypothetical protein
MTWRLRRVNPFAGARIIAYTEWFRATKLRRKLNRIKRAMGRDRLAKRARRWFAKHARQALLTTSCAILGCAWDLNRITIVDPVRAQYSADWFAGKALICTRCGRQWVDRALF